MPRLSPAGDAVSTLGMPLRAQHAWRMSVASKSEMRSPARLLALAIIGLCVDDARNGRKASLDPSWVDIAEVPPSWLESEGVLIWLMPTT